MSTETMNMDEQFLVKKSEADAQRFEKKYEEYITEAAQLFNEKYKGNAEWNSFHTLGLGQYLETWESYSEMFNEDTTTRDHLGDYLKAGLGLAALQYVTMPASFLASVQPINDEVGVIYYRKLTATVSRANLTAGDEIGGQYGKLNHELDQYYSEEVTASEDVVEGTGTYTFSLSTPVRSRTIKVTITLQGGANDGTYQGLDDGEGSIIGNWPTPAGLVTGAVNYNTGVTTINVSDTGVDTVGGVINVQYHQNLAETADPPGFLYSLVSKDIRAQYFILANQYNALADYTIRRRFGRALPDDIASAAVAQINAAVLSTMIRKLKAAAISSGTVTWDSTPTQYVSLYEHRKTFNDAIEGASQLIANQTDRGAISFIIAGSETRKILASNGVDLARKPLPGPYLTGFYEGVPVYFAPQQLIAANEALVGYRGTSWFESPLVYAPFLPVVTVKGTGANPFHRITGVAHAAGVDTVVPGFTARILIS